MSSFWKTCLIAAVLGAVYGIIKFEIFGTDALNQTWDTFIVIVLVFIAITIANKQSTPSE